MSQVLQRVIVVLIELTDMLESLLFGAILLGSRTTGIVVLPPLGGDHVKQNPIGATFGLVLGAQTHLVGRCVRCAFPAEFVLDHAHFQLQA